MMTQKTSLLDNWPSKRIGEGHQESGGEAKFIVIGGFKNLRINCKV